MCEGIAVNPISRRRFLQQTAVAAAALALPRASSARSGAARKKVLLIGAGLAGLVAAYELSRSGHDVTLLEASTRAGGRVWTLREPFSSGLYAEAGAGRIPETHDLTLKYVHLFGLTLDPFYPREGALLYLLRGKRIRVRPGETLDLSSVPFDLSAEERALGLDGLEHKYIDPALEELGNPGAPGWPPEKVKEYDRMTWSEFLRSRGASPGAVALLTALSGWANDSALDFLRDDLGHRGAKRLAKIHGGNDLLPKAFAARLAEKIRYGSPVARIEQDARGVRVVGFEAGSPETLAADYLICAIPFSCLQRVQIAPPFSPEKRRAIEQVLYDPVVRVFCQTKTKFWTKEGLNGFADTDDPMEIWNPTFDQPGARGILMAYLEDGLTRRVAAMPEAERTRFGVEAIARAHLELDKHLESAMSFSWADQPWALGAYSYFVPGQITSLTRAIRQPEGRVHFAGEHASSWPGWMQGAIESGLRAAREVHEAA
jgi:monoamine oxidase